MKIYTKTGDKGTTSVFGGRRVSKTDSQIEACGSIDELTSVIGLVAIKTEEKEKQEFLQKIQVELYQIMAVLSNAKMSIIKLESSIQEFEQKIDNIESQYPTPTRFILPGSNEFSALSHITRTICRRAERAVIYFFETNKEGRNLEEQRSIIIRYLNRLSDLFFMLAREYAKGKEILT